MLQGLNSILGYSGDIRAGKRCANNRLILRLRSVEHFSVGNFPILM